VHALVAVLLGHHLCFREDDDVWLLFCDGSADEFTARYCPLDVGRDYFE
jgi:hypothetical protein